MARPRSAALAAHAQALRERIDDAVERGECIRRGFINEFRMGRGEPCRRALTFAFRRSYGAPPRAYYNAAIAAHVVELRSKHPGMPRCWLVVRTGATEKLIDQVLAQLETKVKGAA